MKDVTIREIGCCAAYCKTCMKQQKKYPDERSVKAASWGVKQAKGNWARPNAKLRYVVSRNKYLSLALVYGIRRFQYRKFKMRVMSKLVS